MSEKGVGEEQTPKAAPKAGLHQHPGNPVFLKKRDKSAFESSWQFFRA